MKKNFHQKHSSKMLRSSVAKIIGSINSKLHGLAKWLQKKALHLSPYQLKCWLGVICLLSMIISGWMIVKGVRKKDEALFKPPAIRFLQFKNSQPPVPSFKKDVKRLEILKVYIDSLHTSKKQGPALDSFFNQHPGLLDTLDRLQQLYKQHNEE